MFYDEFTPFPFCYLCVVLHVDTQGQNINAILNGEHGKYLSDCPDQGLIIRHDLKENLQFTFSKLITK